MASPATNQFRYPRYGQVFSCSTGSCNLDNRHDGLVYVRKNPIEQEEGVLNTPTEYTEYPDDNVELDDAASYYSTRPWPEDELGNPPGHSTHQN